VLKAARYRVAAVVVRPTLLAAFHQQIGTLHWRALLLTECNRRYLNSEIKALLGAAP
jgi:hypothetical protein